MAPAPRPFARFGTEKMVYDVRMGPQALWHGDTVYLVYHSTGGAAAELLGHPYARAYEVSRLRWSEPVRLGSVRGYDHHFAPIIWRDPGGHLHVLYHCHGADGGVHVVSERPDSIAAWRPAPAIAPSISYPRSFPLGGGRLLLYFRTFGHMGNWGYQLSNDGGYTWTRPAAPLVDFDQNPQTNLDTWACTYHSACLSRDRAWLHLGFNYMDERASPNPVYPPPWNNRYHLYYARLEIATGELYAPDGSRLPRPLTRAGAEACKLWHTAHRYSLNPSILPAEQLPAAGEGPAAREQPPRITEPAPGATGQAPRTAEQPLGATDQPPGAGEGGAAFVVPVTDATPHDVVYYFVRYRRGVWERHPIARTNDVWSGSHVTRDADHSILAYLTVGTADGANLRYGGGEIQAWRSRDEGETWRREARLVPEPGLLYNNPKPVERADGSVAAQSLTLFGWQGPGGLEQPQRPFRPLGSSARAYLWLDGEWR